jgi:transcriptional regulator NrdR family protein
MKCPICGVWTRTLETRTNEDLNEIWRRKECANLHTFVTLEQVTAGATPRPRNKSVVAVRSSRSKGAELDAPVHRRKTETDN